MPGAEGPSGWGSWRFLSLLLVRVSLVSEGSAFRLRGSWVRNLHTTGHTHSSCHPPQQHWGAAAGPPQLPPSALPAEHRERPCSLRALAPTSMGKGRSAAPGAQGTFQASGNRREVMPRATTPPEPHDTGRVAAHSTVGATQTHHDTRTDATMIFLNSPRMNN